METEINYLVFSIVKLFTLFKECIQAPNPFMHRVHTAKNL